MTINPELICPCGNYCGVCGVYIATRDKNEKFKEVLVGVFKGVLPGSQNMTAEDIYCGGCLSERKFYYCADCHIRDCTKLKGYEGCHECADFPCQYIEKFPMPVGKKVV